MVRAVHRYMVDTLEGVQHQRANSSTRNRNHHLICVKQLPHCGTRAPGATDLFKTPRPRFGADVAPNDEPLLGPALAGDGSLTALWFLLVNLKLGTDTDVDFEAVVV